jgi:hypothetical protein
MSILHQLSSQVGDRTEKSNREVVDKCLANPALLAEIGGCLNSEEAALVGDCAEVLTEVAKVHPDWVTPHAEALSALLTHKTARVRWEAMHALALVAHLVPAVMAGLLQRLAEIIRHDPSVIVRDHAVDALGNYARKGEEAALATYPLLVEALTLWDGKQAAHALEGLAKVGSAVTGLGDELWSIGIRYHDDRRARVRKAAKGLTKIKPPSESR